MEFLKWKNVVEKVGWWGAVENERLRKRLHRRVATSPRSAYAIPRSVEPVNVLLSLSAVHNKISYEKTRGILTSRENHLIKKQ